MLVLNVSSVAALWFGANRIDAGDLQVGSLIAFLSYLAQILMSVMMATFMVVMVPRAAVCAERIIEVLDTAVDGRLGRPRRSPSSHGRGGRSSCATSASTTPAPRHPVLDGHLASPRRPARPRRSSAARARARPRCSTWCRGCSTSPPARCWSTASTSASSTPSCCGAASAWSRRSRTCSPARWPATCATASPTPPTRSCGPRSRSPRPADFVAAMPGGLDAPIAQGGTNVSGGQRQRLAIARALVRKPEIYLFDDSFSALDLATDARLRAALGPAHRRRHGGDRGASGSRRSSTPTRSSCSRTAARSASAPTRSCSTTARPTPRSSSRSIERRRQRAPSDDDRSPEGGGRRPAAAPERGSGPHGRGRHAGREVEGLRRGDPAAAASLAARAGRWRCWSSSWRSSASRCPCSARRSSATPPTSSSTGVSGQPAASTSPRCTASLLGVLASTSCSAVLAWLQAYLLAGVVQRTMSRLRGRRRGQAQPPAARLRRPPAPRRPAQPGHQRHRQHRPEPAADAQPDADLGAHHRRRGRDDVHRSRRCSPSSRWSPCRCRS